MEKNSNHCITTKSSFYNNAEPCDSKRDSMLGTTIQIDYNVLLTPSLDMPSDITFDGIKNRLLCGPQPQPNRKQKASTSSRTLLSIPQDPNLYPNSIHSSITRCSHNNILIHLKSTPTLHETLNSVISTVVPLSHSKLKSQLLSLLIRNQKNNSVFFAETLFKVLEVSCTLKNLISSAWIKVVSITSSEQQMHQTVIEQEFPDNCVTKI